MTEPLDWARLPGEGLRDRDTVRRLKVWRVQNERQGRIVTMHRDGSDAVFEARELSTPTGNEILDREIAAIRTVQRYGARKATVSEALSIPAVQRAVNLISHTGGSLKMQGFRDGSPMNPTPPILARPNPWETDVDNYRAIFYGLATYGETILCVMTRDEAGFPMSVKQVPNIQLNVQANPKDAMRPLYDWGKPDGTQINSTRYSPVNRDGRFIHIVFNWDETGLRGVGPLQQCGAALNVALEAQLWAASFFQSGGVPPIVVKSATELGSNEAIDGVDAATEAELLRNAWMAGAPNTPKVIDPNIESVTQFDTNEQGAQMLDARLQDRGQIATMFGIPGALLEYNSPGSSLHYQNDTSVWLQFTKGCLNPGYMKPVEANFSDLLPRTQSAEFNIGGLLRADIKTRFDVYNIGVPLGIIDVDQAKQDEGYIPGNIETLPVPPSPPQAVFTSKAVRCDGDRMKNGIMQVCNNWLSDTGPFVGTCRKCKKLYPARVA